MKKIVFIFSIIFLFFSSCKDESPANPADFPFNPFDTLTYPLPNIVQVPVDSNGFLGLHHYIFSNTCNRPGCHDGTFEPDFRTVESSYNTLVYHPIIKNYDIDVDGREPLPFRITPFETEQSMLYKRITEHFLPNFEIMPSSGNQLSQEKVDLIHNWINDGAKDIFGNIPTLASVQPACYGVVAYLPDNNDLRIDTFRVDGYRYNPYIIPANEDVRMWFYFVDRDINGDWFSANGLTYNKIQFSTDAIDFSNAIERDLNVGFAPLFENSVFGNYVNYAAAHYQNIIFNSADLGFQSGDLVYFRSYVKDNDHNDPTEIPSENAPPNLTTYFSFVVQ